MNRSSVTEIIADAAARLESVTQTPRLDAEILLAHTMKVSRAQLLAMLGEEADPGRFEDVLKRRIEAEPLAYILGEWEFFSMAFEIKPPVLVPRPETEHLVEVVLEAIGDGAARVLDLGTGSGCVAVAIARNAPNCTLAATDIRSEFLELAHRNAEGHGVAGRIKFYEGDLFEALAPEDAPFDAICSNPPYVAESDWTSLPPVITRYEDSCALLAGPDGLDVIRSLTGEAQAYLVPGGILAFEIGMGQFEAVRELLRDGGYEDIGSRRDLAGIERIAIGRVPSGD